MYSTNSAGDGTIHPLTEFHLCWAQINRGYFGASLPSFETPVVVHWRCALTWVSLNFYQLGQIKKHIVQGFLNAVKPQNTYLVGVRVGNSLLPLQLV